VKGLTDYLKEGAFNVIATVGCFFETSIALNIEPYNQEFDFAIAIPYVLDAESPERYHYETMGIRMFQTEIEKCYASRLILCQDVECASLFGTESLKFESNPTEKDEFGFNDAVLRVDRFDTTVNQDIFIMGTTLDPNVNATAKGRIAVCGERFSFAAEDVNNVLDTQLVEPYLPGDKEIDLLQLFSFAVPSTVFPTEACLKEVRICDDFDCGVEDQFAG
jgi:hypothetical protein